MNDPQKPQYILFAQHGWSDNSDDIGYLARELVGDEAVVVSPSLGLVNTYWRIARLVKKAETIIQKTITQYPDLPLRMMGHSMGGLICLEVLDRNPQWWSKVHSLVVIGSPIGGAHLARIIDPLGLGIGIARDLGQNHRPLAEKIAQNIPTFSIAGELGNGTDGMVNTEATKFAHARYQIIPGVAHARLKRHLDLIPLIQEFWANSAIAGSEPANLVNTIIRQLQQVKGMTDADYQFLAQSELVMQLPQGMELRSYSNQFGVEHVFVVDSQGSCLYAGYVGWLHKRELEKAIAKISAMINP